MRLSKQCQQIVNHIDRWGSINSIEAIRHYGITRLAARIHDLRGTVLTMKAVKDANLAPGFVKYVPDWKARRMVMKRLQMIELLDSNGESLADLNVKYAAKFSMLNIKEREHVSN